MRISRSSRRPGRDLMGHPVVSQTGQRTTLTTDVVETENPQMKRRGFLRESSTDFCDDSSRDNTLTILSTRQLTQNCQL